MSARLLWFGRSPWRGEAVRVDAGRNKPDRLALEHGKGRVAEVENDVVDVDVGILVSEAIIARDRRDRGLFAIEEIDRRLGGRGGRNRLAARALVRAVDQRLHVVVDGFRLARDDDLLLRGKLVPGILLVERIGRRDDAPIVDRSRRAGRDAIQAEFAFGHVDDVIVGVVRDRVDRAGLLASIAANADFRIDEMLLDRRVHGFIQIADASFATRRGPDRESSAIAILDPRSLAKQASGMTARTAYAAMRTYSKSPGLLSMPTFGAAIQPAYSPTPKWPDISEFRYSPSDVDGR